VIVKSFSWSCEYARDIDDWRLRTKGAYQLSHMQFTLFVFTNTVFTIVQAIK